ncbi:MAG: molybdopterin dinucleotide binding domain-containing protein, partial [Planctomycetota bacterium]
RHKREVCADEAPGERIEERGGLATVAGKVAGVAHDGAIREGFPTPSRRIEIHSGTLEEWGFPEQAIPGLIRSQVGPGEVDPEEGVYALVPTFRLPTMIHTRSGNAKWLTEISHANPVWIHPEDAGRHAIADGELIRIETPIGWFVNRARVTEGIRPGVLACSHHMGRWRLEGGPGSRWSGAEVRIEELDGGLRRLRIARATGPFDSQDPDSRRIWWRESGVHQNLAFPVQPDPASGMHCWHQVVRLRKPAAGDRYGDVVVDRERSREHYRTWLARARPAPGPGGLRRPLWMPRPLRPADEAYRL